MGVGVSPRPGEPSTSTALERPPGGDTHYRHWWSGFSASAEGAVAAEQAAQLCQLLALDPGQRVLDVPCGDGRLSVALAGRGIQVTGIDRDGAALARARIREAAIGLTWIEADMAAMPPLAPFDAAICFWNSFGYLSDEGNTRFLTDVRRLLKPGGRLFVDTSVIETVFRRWTTRSWKPCGTGYSLQERSFDFVTSCLYRKWTHLHGGETVERVTCQRVYSVCELVTRLRDAGFGDIQLMGDLAAAPFDADAKQLCVVAARDEE